MNKYLLRKLTENNVNPDNVIGFYWDGLHEDEGLVQCSISEMPRILSHDYILLKCESCGKEFYKRVIDVLPTCHHCNQLEHWEASKTDYKPILHNIKSDYNLLGYYVEGSSGEFIEESNIDDLPKLHSLNYVRLQCTKCGTIVDRRLNHVKELLGCPTCLAKERGFSQRAPWKERLIKFESEYDMTVLGYYDDQDNYHECTVHNLPSLTKRSCIRLRCNHCKKESDRGLYHLDYGCKHGEKTELTRVTGELETRYGVLGYDSGYELQFIRLIQNIDAITAVISQPQTHIISYEFNNGTHKYYPDFLVTYNNREYIIEIKPTTAIDRPQIQAKIHTALRYCIDHLLTYIVITEDDLFYGNPVENIIERLNTEDNKLQIKEFE